ncbi:uncharacterized protein NECHADRAFT_82108 [Fusarium vanettenii 77-13-4]|uniref:Uncharacterized protein n=1 Tax=Fusarium vanettenii (strain ATCC MYA-4622 / CBS 123669 / FGSC 9596 / NRRL 45880 / 77-13-4) TaxID=660122 RepID=C7ZAI4_FUSV7|nr:uncharacterized protein NECHADRAFT_82108 [Fusarium vanettenii 77-13-4]EEU39683.1 predicted protein [Fusarium vanettenii 77-13-4]
MSQTTHGRMDLPSASLGPTKPLSCLVSENEGQVGDNLDYDDKEAKQPIDLSPGSIIQRQNDGHPFVIKRTRWNENGEELFWGHSFTSRPKFKKFEQQYEIPGPEIKHFIYIGGGKPNKGFDPKHITPPTVPELDLDGPPMRLYSYIVIEECGPYKRDDFAPYENQQHRLSRSGVEKLLGLSTTQGPEEESFSERTRRATQNTPETTPNPPHTGVQPTSPPRQSLNCTTNRGWKSPFIHPPFIQPPFAQSSIIRFTVLFAFVWLNTMDSLRQFSTMKKTRLVSRW